MFTLLVLSYLSFLLENCPTAKKSSLLQVIELRLPYSDLCPEILIFMVGSGKMKPDLNRLNPKPGGVKSSGTQSCPELMKSFIECCLNFDAKKRPEFDR